MTESPIIRVSTIAEVAEEWGTTDPAELQALAQAEHDALFTNPGRVSVADRGDGSIEFRIDFTTA
jgi:hypothetical protein